ncbi:hypothetical protein [Sphingobacterium deserti]|uniref:Uncharacterized protein n=1 Tax=Sphingobacterium deserti TaxID=1229276 RepID=A0A0B8T2Z8_9SPHI|nr:hypothetical protein [Sphingobacterium deserti]KGE15792.1 hypothetical protein DI53_0433 [Sphingobacterium deserti]
MAYTKESIFSKIGELLLELNDGYTELSESGEGIKAIDILLLEAKAKFLTTHLEVLRQLESPVEQNTAAATKVGHDASENDTEKEIVFTPPVVLNEAADKQPVEEEIEEEQASSVEDSSPAPVDAPNETESSSATEPSSENDNSSKNLFSTPEVAAHDEVDSPVSVEESTQKDSADQPFEKVTENEAVEAVVNEVIQAPKEIVIESKPVQEEVKPSRPLTLNEMLQQQRQAQSGLGQVHNNPIPTAGVKSAESKVVDLKTVINLNDKLLFIKDLFNGYSLAYSEAIELLNRYNSFAEADVFLQTNYALKNNWADKPQTVEKLYAVLRKKFM